MKSGVLVQVALRWNARHFVEALYQALLGRSADAHGLATYSTELARDGDLASIARSIAGSGEAWEKSLIRRTPAIIGAVFRGLLGRDPEREALEAYSASFSDHRDLGILLDDIGRSEEHWRRLLAIHAEAVVRAVFQALLKRQPEPEAIAVYAQQIRQSADLASLISVVADSAEHRQQLAQSERAAEPSLRSDDLTALLAEVVPGATVWNDLVALRFPQSAPAHEALGEDAWVFIHAQKTGGTSVQNMLADTFGAHNVYREKGDTLFRRSPAELAPFSLFAGHFDYNSVAYIPRRTRHLITFLREPRQRLLSLYRFLRAHEPGSPDFNGRKQIANRLDAESFFRSVMALAGGDLWNHLTWCVMGQRKWNAYRHRLSSIEGSVAEHLEAIRPEIRARLQEFRFIGLMEDFPHSCERLFEMIGARLPHLRHDHMIEALTANARHFKPVPLPALTPQLEKALAPLVQLDAIVYEEGRDLYQRSWGRVADGEGYRPA